jgi:hypothetical protein
MRKEKLSHCFFCGSEVLIDTDITSPKTSKPIPLDINDRAYKHICAASEAILYDRYDSPLRKEKLLIIMVEEEKKEKER